MRTGKDYREALRDGRRVLLVMLGAHDRWWGAHAILARAHAR